MENDSRDTVLKTAFRDSLPILMGYGTMGFAAGVVFAAASPAKPSALWNALIAATSFSGTLQFAMAGWMRDNEPLLFVALATAGISFRYMFYGFSLVARWKEAKGLKKLFLIFSLTDENYALECGRRFSSDAAHVRYSLALCSLNLAYWIGGNTLGALFGSVFSLPDKGVEFVMAALFITILTDQARKL